MIDFDVTPLTPVGVPAESIYIAWIVKNKLRLIGAFAGIFVIILTILVLTAHGGFKESAVELMLTGPTTITSGDLIEYTISYANHNKIALDGARLIVSYPEDAVAVKDGIIAEQTSDEMLDIGNVAVGQGAEKKVSAYIVGDKGAIKTLKAVLSYTPHGINSSFRKESFLATTISTLAVPITVVAPPTAVNGQAMSYIIDYRNTSDADISDLRLKMTFPDGFKATTYSLNPSIGNGIWDFPSLKKGDGSRITIQGMLSGREQDNKIVSLILQKRITMPQGDRYIDFEKLEARTIISVAPLSLDIKLNEVTDYTAHLADTLRYVLTYRNGSTVALSGLALTARLEGSMFDLTTLETDGFFDSRTNTVIWNTSAIPEFNNFAPNQTGSVKLSVRLKSTFGGGSIGTNNSLVKITAQLATPTIPAGLGLDTLGVSKQLVTRISVGSSFTQSVALNDAQLGTEGPFPPRVDSRTAFTIHWHLINPSDDIAQARVSAVLAPGVTWSNKTRVGGSQPPLSFNAKTNTVSWDLGTLSGGVGLAFPADDSYFQVTVTPSVNQVGQPVTLLKNIRFEGINTLTKEKIARVLDNLTTSSVSDSSVSGYVQSK